MFGGSGLGHVLQELVDSNLGCSHRAHIFRIGPAPGDSSDGTLLGPFLLVEDKRLAGNHMDVL